MLRNFLKITLRNFSRNKSYVLINVLGLGITLACCIVAYLNWRYVADYDKNHANHENIYKIHVNKLVKERKVQYGITPLGLGSAIKDKTPGITHTSRFNSLSLVIKKDLKVFTQRVGFVDEDFLDMFTYPFKYGNKTALNDLKSVVLSEQVASAYFGDVDPTGEIVNIILENGNKVPLTVGGVLQKIPSNSSITFGALTQFDNYLSIRNITDQNWVRAIDGTFIMKAQGVDPSSFLEMINDNYVAIQNEANAKFKIDNYYLEQLTTLNQNVENIRSNWLNAPPPNVAVTVPAFMAFLLLLVACFNFTNTSIAISSKRLKEIGIRKVMGSARSQLIVQFMGENLILVLASILVSLGIASYLVPTYSAMWAFIDLELDVINNPEIFLFLFALMIGTAVLAGAYPSLYISAYQPVKILRGNLTLGKTNFFSKFLLGFQYLLTAVALISAFSFSNNIDYQNSLDIGFKKDNIISIRTPNASEHEKFRNTVAQLPFVNTFISTAHHIGWWTYSRTVRSGEEELEVEMMDFSLGYQDLMELEILEGRYFAEDLLEFDQSKSVIVNEELVAEYGWENPLGQVIQVDDTTRLNVIGVMKNFYMYGFFDTVPPAAFRLADKSRTNFLLVKVDERPKEMYEVLEEKWYAISPTTPFNGDYANDSIAESAEINSNITVMFRFLGSVALILSSIGLYTLVSLNVIKRIKEIGIRKVLGAKTSQILILINKQFALLLFISISIGSVLSYFAADSIMSLIFVLYQAINIQTILVPVFLLIIIAFGIAGSRVLITAARNPVESLRDE